MFGERIKYLRRKNNLKQEDLAILLKVTHPTVSKWELEKAEPSIEFLIKLSEIFNVSIDYLVGSTSIKQNYKLDSKLEAYLIDCINTYEKHINKD